MVMNAEGIFCPKKGRWFHSMIQIINKKLVNSKQKEKEEYNNTTTKNYSQFVC